MTRLLLASASPARRTTLLAAGITPLVAVSEVDEEALLARTGPLPPAEAVLTLARAKAEDVARNPVAGTGDLVVLGCDSMLELDGEVLGKPSGAAQATERWRAMRGRCGVLHTGHWLIDARPAGGGAGRGQVAGAPDGAAEASRRSSPRQTSTANTDQGTSDAMANARPITPTLDGTAMSTPATRPHHAVARLKTRDRRSRTASTSSVTQLKT